MSSQAIYSIEYNNNIYIGETCDINKRLKRHKHNQNIFSKLMNVQESPVFKILEKLPSDFTKKQRNLSNLVNGKQKICKGWKLCQR